MKTFPNIFVPIISPTLKKANFGPNSFVKPKEIRTSKINMTKLNKISFLIKLDLHNKSYTSQDTARDDIEIIIA